MQVHHGTREAPARVVPLGGGFAQLRLEAPLVAAAGDRVILRQMAPPDTIGGGVVVDAAPRKHGARAEVVERLRRRERGEPDEPARATRSRRRPSSATPSPEPLDDRALPWPTLLREDGCAPRADGELAAAAGLDRRRTRHAASARLERAGLLVRVARNLHFHPEPLGRPRGASRGDLRARRRRPRSPASATSSAPRAGTRRRCSSTSTATKVTRRDGDAHVLRRRRGG